MASGLYTLQANISRNITRCIKRSADTVSSRDSTWRFLTSFAVCPSLVHDTHAAEVDQKQSSNTRSQVSELHTLKEREKGDWRNLTLEEKQALYRMSFSQPFHLVDQPANEWKLILAGTFTAMGLTALGLYLWNSQFEKPETPIGPLSVKKEFKGNKSSLLYGTGLLEKVA